MRRPNYHEINLDDREVFNFDASSHEASMKKEKFSVAIITAGDLRSFAFVRRSWERYILTAKNKEVIRIFAHAVVSGNCPITAQGLRSMKELATRVEIYYPTVTYGRSVLSHHIRNIFVNGTEKLNMLTSMIKGNIIDMNERRFRAYHLAKEYALENNFNWSLICFIRPDTAFFHSRFDFYLWHLMLTTFPFPLNQTQSFHPPIYTPDPYVEPQAIYIPSGCNFGGVCDRFAVGLPAAMDIYFQRYWILDVLQFISPIKGRLKNWRSKRTISPLDKHMITNLRDPSFSEMSLYTWFIMNNLYQYDILPRQVSFLTLRTRHIDQYCNFDRSQTESNEDIFFGDRMLLNYNLGADVEDFDKVASAEERCGKEMLSLFKNNASDVCLSHPLCSC